MPYSVNSHSDTWTPLQGLPFAGLGFDLAVTELRAMQLALRPMAQGPERVLRARLEPFLSGYDLQLFLCREIRAG